MNTEPAGETLRGTIDRITFHNLDNGWCVLKVQARGHTEPVTVVGHLSQVVAGEFIEAEGEWTTDRQHGPQFKAKELKTSPPHSAAGIAKYLAGGLVKGIGPTYAKKITDVFGDKTLDVIDLTPSMLKQIKGIGPKRIERIRTSWQEQKHVHRIMAFLHSHGIGTARAVRIYKTYGENAIQTVRANPYRLSTDIWGVGFRTADELALKLGLPRDGQARAQAAIRHVLKEAASDGHVCLPEPLLIEETTVLTQIRAEILQEALDNLTRLDEIVRDASEVHEEPLIYLKPLHLAEVGLARSIVAQKQGTHPLPSTDAEAALAWVEAAMKMDFADRQREAVTTAATEKFLILTGGPGTGKTTIVRAVIELYAAKHQRVALCAPTGRAAKRLSESTGREARTIHRLLEFDAALGTFRRTRENPLDIDLLVVDEVSMADVVLANQLLRAVPPWAAVLLVGDCDQLPSVGPGSVLGDLISSGVVPVVTLNRVHRQAESSWIVRAAHAVNDGREPESAPSGGQGDFYFVEADDAEIVIDRILEMVKTRIPARFGLDSFAEVQVLAPMNKATVGVANLNQRLQAALNPPAGPSREVGRYGTVFRIGDKVMQTRNNYQREVYNGDIGRILSVDAIDQAVMVEYDARPVEYDFADLDELTLAYAVSIHKSQGSEYPAVVIPVHTQHWIMMQRNLIYTGITRGRKLVVLVGSRKALNRAVNTSDTARRFTMLAERLRKLSGDA